MTTEELKLALTSERLAPLFPEYKLQQVNYLPLSPRA